MDENLIPLRLLRRYSQAFPLAWRQIASMRKDRGKALPFWPDWCYCPIAASIAIVTDGVTRLGPEEVAKIQEYPPAAMAALAAWRITKGAYRFDESLLQELAKMPIEGDLPAEVFYQLPEWSIYIETPGMIYLDQEIAGFFASLEYDVNDNRQELRLLFVNEALSNIPMPLHLGKWTLRESIDRAIIEGQRNFSVLGLNEQLPGDEERSYLADQLEPFLNLVIYICSVNADYGERERPRHPSQLPRRKGKLPAAGEVRSWDIGVRVGTALKRTVSAGGSAAESMVDGRRQPRSHYRRAHWHHFWVGPRDGERKLIVKWLPPIPVNVTDEDEKNQPAVIKPVK